MPLYLKDKLVSGTGAQGSPGKSAYEAAKEGGYEGMETAFNTALNDLPVHIGNADIHVTAEERTSWNGKQDKLTFDAIPTANSTNPVTSGGVKTELDKKANAPKSVSVTLAAASWDSTAKTQTVTVTGISATEMAQMITPTPALASQTAYYDAGILCTGQAADSLTFTANTIPTADLTVYVVIQEVAQE